MISQYNDRFNNKYETSNSLALWYLWLELMGFISCMDVTQNGWSIVGNSIEMDDLELSQNHVAACRSKNCGIDCGRIKDFNRRSSQNMPTYNKHTVDGWEILWVVHPIIHRVSTKCVGFLILLVPLVIIHFVLRIFHKPTSINQPAIGEPPFMETVWWWVRNCCYYIWRDAHPFIYQLF